MSELLWILTVTVLAVLIAWALGAASREKELPGLSSRASIRYTRHALQRMRERGVTRSEVELVLRRPQRATRDQGQSSVRLERDFGDKKLKVWVAEPWPETREAVVKSTAWQYILTFAIPVAEIGRVKGKGGRKIQSMEEEALAAIRIDADGNVRISGESRSAVETAKMLVLRHTGDRSAKIAA